MPRRWGRSGSWPRERPSVNRQDNEPPKGSSEKSRRLAKMIRFLQRAGPDAGMPGSREWNRLHSRLGQKPAGPSQPAESPEPNPYESLV